MCCHFLMSDYQLTSEWFLIEITCINVKRISSLLFWVICSNRFIRLAVFIFWSTNIAQTGLSCSYFLANYSFHGMWLWSMSLKAIQGLIHVRGTTERKKQTLTRDSHIFSKKSRFLLNFYFDPVSRHLKHALESGC